MTSKTCVILGATGGIGSELARRLASKGWSLVLASRGGERLDALAEELGAVEATVDVTDSASVKALFDGLKEDPAGVVNCVGSILLKPVHMTRDEEWHETMALNLHGAFYTVREATRRMKKSGGSIVLCSTAAASIGLSNHEAIAAAKAGVEGLVRSAAATYASAGIRLNAVAPGLVDTPMSERITKVEANLKVSLGMHPVGRIGTAGDIASAIEWFLDPGNSWVTGQVLRVDGGLSGIKLRG